MRGSPRFRARGISTRGAANMHDTATRCTACHPSSFSTEANLTAHRNGYEIRSKSNFQFVIDRLYNSNTPLYGDDGLFWQRFIGIPLQAQGKQGGILLDFERQVSCKETKTVERFGPFLARAWATRRDLPPDEQNGVVPLDSKFGFAWRDWRVLSELAARTGRAEFATAAASIAAILHDRAVDRRIETLQDRIHRLYAWSLIDKEAFASQIKRETLRVLRVQNADGGWHESEPGDGPSAVYTTGQLTWTLLRTGLPRDHPALVKACRYLLSQQQDFGGWFQTTTHENFRTPMRETRFAVMALAEAFPRPGAPLFGWGNRQSGPPRLPRSDCAREHPRRPRKPLGRSSGRSRPVRSVDRRAARASRSRRCGPRPQPPSAGSDRPNQPLRWPGGWPTPRRSSGGRPRGRCADSATTEKMSK